MEGNEASPLGLVQIQMSLSLADLRRLVQDELDSPPDMGCVLASIVYSARFNQENDA